MTPFGATEADPLCSHTCLHPSLPALPAPAALPAFLLLPFHSLRPSQPSFASTQVSSLQPSQADGFMLSVLFPPDTSEGVWAVL